MRLIRNMWCFTGSGRGFILQYRIERLQKEAGKGKRWSETAKEEGKMTVDPWRNVSGDERRL